MNARERLRRAAEDGERLYRVRMHSENGPTIADDNRIDGILTLDLTDALGALDVLIEAVTVISEGCEQPRDVAHNALHGVTP